MAHDLDIEQPSQLLAYLFETNRLPPGTRASVKVLGGGVSNRTVMVEADGQSALVIKQALPRLRVQVEWLSDPLRIHQEALALRWLSRVCPEGSLPSFVFEDTELHLLGMSAVSQPHENWKTMLMRGDLQTDHVRQFATLAAAIHEQTQGAEFARIFANTAFFESLRLEPYYLFTASRIPEAGRFLHELVEETRRTRLCVVHGDYSPKNVLVYRGQLVLLDHEVIHFGDPTFDLGFGLTHLLSKAHHLPKGREPFLQAADLFWSTYQQQAALSRQPGFEARAVRQTLGCLLARVEGRSPLEYLTPTERVRQREVTVELMSSPPETFGNLFEAWRQQLESTR